MPNWVNNSVSITGAKENLDRLFKFLEEARDAGKSFCGSFRPMPEELLTISTGGCTIDGVSYREWREVEDGFYPDGRKKTKSVAISAEELKELVEKYGTCSWYDWACKNWGVKWDYSMQDGKEDCDFNLTRRERSISFFMICPWSLPDPIYKHIASEYNVKVRVELDGEWDGPDSYTYTSEGCNRD